MASSSASNNFKESPSLYQNKLVVVTGGGSGIGKALCFAFAQAGSNVVVADLRGADNVCNGLPTIQQQQQQQRHMAINVDVTNPTAIQSMFQSIKRYYKNRKIDIYCSNAGIMIPSNPTDDSCIKHSLHQWEKIMQVNVLSHVTALKELLKDWETEGGGGGGGHFCVTASAAGLLTMIGDASYGVSKAAALSFCEHVAISHYPTVNVHCLCPQAVDTPLVQVSKESNAAMSDGMLSPDAVATATLKAIEQNEFFIFPHPQVSKYALRKAKNHQRWLQGMRKMRNHLMNNSNNKLSPTEVVLRSKL